MYEALAKYYDMFMDDVPYDKWTDYLLEFLPAEGRGADIGCGTGAFTLALKKRGYDITGVDLSERMLSLAQEKAVAAGVSIPFILGDASSLRLHRPVDFITANCDVVNYLRSPLGFFRSAYAALKQGGVFIFDISTQYKLKNILGDNVYTARREGVTYIWENFYDAKRARVDMRLTFFALQPNNYYSEYTDEQTQYAHRAEELTAMLERAGFKSVRTYGFLSRSAPREREERIHFVALKEE